MADPEDYVYCNNDLEVHAGDRTSYKTAGWWSTNMASEGMCNWSVCGAGDVRDWFAAANKYIRGDGDSFKNHFDRYKSNIQMSQGAARRRVFWMGGRTTPSISRRAVEVRWAPRSRLEDFHGSRRGMLNPRDPEFLIVLAEIRLWN